MIRFRSGKCSGSGGAPGPNSLTSSPVLQISRGQRLVLRRIDAVEPGAEDGHRRRPPASRHPRCAAESTPRARPLATTTPRPPAPAASRRADVQRVGRRRPRSDDRDGGPAEDAGVAADPQDRRRIGNAAEERRIARIDPRAAARCRRRGAAASAASARDRASATAATLRLGVGHLARRRGQLRARRPIRDRLLPEFLEGGGDPRARCGQHRDGDGGAKVHARPPRRRTDRPHRQSERAGAAAALQPTARPLCPHYRRSRVARSNASVTKRVAHLRKAGIAVTKLRQRTPGTRIAAARPWYVACSKSVPKAACGASARCYSGSERP